MLVYGGIFGVERKLIMIESYTEVVCEFGGKDPGVPKDGEMQVFYENGIPQMVDFKCPCGCGYTCPTPVSEKGKKEIRHWEFWKNNKGEITLSPSIRWTGGCFAHFNITEGKVQLHGDSGVPTK